MLSPSRQFFAAGGFVIPAKPTVQGSAQTSGAPITLPAHAINDILILSVVNTSSTTATGKPSAGGTVPNWIDIDAPAGSNSEYMRTVYAIASRTDHTVGAWTNTSGMTANVIRGAGGSIIGGHGLNNNASSTNCTAPAITLTRTDGSSLILCIHRTPSFSPGAAPAGYTRVTTSGSWVYCINTKDVTTSDGSIANTCASGTNQAAQIEICSY